MVEDGPLARPERMSIAAALGGYASLAALAADPRVLLALAAPLIALPLGWWTILTAERWLALFFFAALLLPPLPFALGNSGPHPAVALAGLGLVAGVLRLSGWRIEPTALNGGILIYTSALLASVAFAALYSGIQIAAGSLARVLLFAVSAYVFLYTAYGPGARAARDPFRSARALFWAGTISAGLACVDFYFQFPAPAGFGPQFVWLDSGVYRRAQGVFYEASTLGNVCSFFLLMTAVALARRPGALRFVSRAGLTAGAVVLSTALVLSYSRSSLINLIGGACVLIFMERKRLNLRRLVVMAGAGMCACVLISYALFPEFAELYWVRLRMSLQFFMTSPAGVLSGRLESWGLLLKFLASHPWYAFFGIGYKTLPYSTFTGSAIIADNMYLSALVETGLTGLAALLIFNGAILQAAYKAARDADPRASFFGTVLFCFWAGQMLQMFSVDLLTFWRVLPIYFWVLAVAVRSMRGRADSNTLSGPV